MSQLYVSGPTQWFTQTAGATGALGWEFFGLCEGETTLNFAAEWEDVMVDAMGARIPYDVAFMGEQVYISGDIKLFNEAVFQRIASRLGVGSLGGGIAGTYGGGPAGAIGTLMRLEGAAYGLVIRSAYGSKVIMSNGGMPPGLYFPTSWADAPIDVKYSTRPTVKRMGFRAIPTPNLTNLTYSLFSTTLPTLPAIN